VTPARPPGSDALGETLAYYRDLGVAELYLEEKEEISLKVNRARGGVASGPAKLCAYLGVTTALSGSSLSGPELILSRGPRRRFDVLVGPRVGVDYAGAAAAWPLRFAVAGCPAVTKPKSLGMPGPRR